MAFNYTITETEKENLPNGKYIGLLKSVEDKVFSYNGEMISYVSIGWELFDPLEYTGRMEYENFYIGHSDEKKRNRAKWQFSIFCKQIAQLRTGETVAEEHLIGKKAELTVENNTSDNGKTYQNIVNRVLLPSQSNKEISDQIIGIAGSGMQPLQAPVYPSDALSDQVPF